MIFNQAYFLANYHCRFIILMQRVDLAIGTDNIQVDPLEVSDKIEPSNMQAAKKLINKYQQKIRQLQIVQHPKMANDQLKEELKKLNDTLNGLLPKLSTKAKPLKQQVIHDEITKKQLENEMKKTASLRKQIQALKAKMRVYESQKLSEMQDEIREKDKIIESMHQNIKLHQKFQKKDMNMDIYKREQEAQIKIKALSQEIVHLKKKIQEQRKLQDQQNRSMNFQQQQIIALQENKRSLSKLNSHSPQIQTSRNLIQQENERLQQLFKSSENSRKNLQKSSKIEADLLRSKLRQAQKTIEDIRQQLVRKQKQLAIMNMRLKMAQKGNLLITESKQDETWNWVSPSEDCRRQLLGLTNFRASSRKFDDSTSLPFDSQFRISKLIFNYFQEHIVQLKVQYQILGSEKSQNRMQMISSFSIDSHYNSMKEAELALSDYEYIKQWQIYCGKFIQFMKIRTSKQQVLQIGNQRSSLKCKRYSFDIKNYEKPVAVFGVLQLKNIADKESEVLVNLGLLLKKKNVLGKRAKSLAKLQLRTSSVLLNALNDKNKMQ